MLKDFFYDADKIISRLGDIGIIPMCSVNNKAVISGKSKDNSIIFSVVSKEDGYDEKYFAFRDLNTISGILQTFKGSSDLSVELKRVKSNDDGFEYPSRIVFKSGSTTVEHFLQRYSIICKSNMVLNDFNNKKAMVVESNELIPLDMTDSIASELISLSSIVNRPLFHIEKIGDRYYYCFGDISSKSTDFAKVELGDLPLSECTGYYYPIDIVYAIAKALKFDCRISIKKKNLFIFGETDNCKIGISFAGKTGD